MDTLTPEARSRLMSRIRGKDTMDVWFDSGTTWTSLASRSQGKPVADVCVEGSDQHRGW
ncbi:MAG: hypothetical protein EOO38_10075, partial [Cytophagaceae bacterium]